MAFLRICGFFAAFLQQFLTKSASQDFGFLLKIFWEKVDSRSLKKFDQLSLFSLIFLIPNFFLFIRAEGVALKSKFHGV